MSEEQSQKFFAQFYNFFIKAILFFIVIIFFLAHILSSQFATKQISLIINIYVSNKIPLFQYILNNIFIIFPI
jgi:hypothetical protein